MTRLTEEQLKLDVPIGEGSRNYEVEFDLQHLHDFAEAYELCEDLFIDYLGKWNDAAESKEMRYWQGKKDGLRMALTLLAPTAEKAKSWAVLQMTSGKGDLLDKELDLLEERW